MIDIIADPIISYHTIEALNYALPGYIKHKIIPIFGYVASFSLIYSGLLSQRNNLSCPPHSTT